MVIIDPTFNELLGKRNAVGYGQLPSFGLLINPPLVYFNFDDETSARSCFEIFQGWIERSGDDGDAVEITFISFKDGSYGVVTGPEMRRAIER